jgi:hypothetical protein
MKGGSRRSGPAPDPNALKRERDSQDWVTLPSKRDGDTPKWPLEAQSEREADLWEQEWTRPQAVMWESNRQEVEVAMYVRSIVAAEQMDAPTNARTLVRQQQEALGLSVPGLQRNRWKIPADSPLASGSKPVAAKSEARRRFKVVKGGG